MHRFNTQVARLRERLPASFENLATEMPIAPVQGAAILAASLAASATAALAHRSDLALVGFLAGISTSVSSCRAVDKAIKALTHGGKQAKKSTPEAFDAAIRQTKESLDAKWQANWLADLARDAKYKTEAKRTLREVRELIDGGMSLEDAVKIGRKRGDAIEAAAQKAAMARHDAAVAAREAAEKGGSTAKMAGAKGAAKSKASSWSGWSEWSAAATN